MKIRKKKLKAFIDESGSLIPIEFKDIDFEPKRLFYVTNVPKNCRRGNHSHFKTRQLLICVRGSIGVVLTDKEYISDYVILSENEYVYVPNLIWDAQDFLTGNDVLLVLCSTNFDEKDYIYDKSVMYEK